MSDRELRGLGRNIETGKDLFRLTVTQMRHGFVDLTTLITAIKYLEIQAKNIVAEDLRSHPTYVLRDRVPIGESREQIRVHHERDLKGYYTHSWVGLPKPESSFHLTCCSHCRCPIWTGDCDYCGRTQGPYGRPGRYESPWSEEHYLERVFQLGWGSRMSREEEANNNFFQFYVRTRWGDHKLVPAYQLIGGMIRETLQELDDYQWPDFTLIREAFCLQPIRQCAAEGCDGVARNQIGFRNVFPFVTTGIGTDSSEIPALNPYCWSHSR